MFGGQASLEEDQALVKATLTELAHTQYPGAVFFHLRVWAAKLAVKAATEDPAIAAYLAGKQNLFTVTINPQLGKALLQQVQVAEGTSRPPGCCRRSR